MTRLDRRRQIGRCLAVMGLVLVTGGSPRPAAPLTDDGAELARIETYLNGLTTLRSSFLQINPDGGTVTGTLRYARPDKMRLDYDPPANLLIVANSWELIYYDRELDQETHLFISSTPLAFLLQEEIRLSGDVTVTDVGRDGDLLSVTLVQTDEPDEGAITLWFDAEPLALRRWTVTDPQGARTHVVLQQTAIGVELADDLFRFRNAKQSAN